MRVVREIDNLSLQSFDDIRVNAHYRPIISYAQQDSSTILVEKGADGLWGNPLADSLRSIVALSRCVSNFSS